MAPLLPSPSLVLVCVVTVALLSAPHATAVHAAAAAGADSPPPPPPFTVFGYLPEYRQARFDYEAVFRAGLTHLIFFSAEVDPATLRLAHVDDRLPAMAEWRQIRSLADQYGVKLMLCLGGGGRSAGFAGLVASDERRRLAFIDEVNAVVLARQLDGIDINWEYPQSTTEWLQLGRLLVELRSALGYSSVAAGNAAAGPIGERRHRSQQRRVALSMALHPHPSIPGLLRSTRVLAALDYVHWMAYDHVVGDGGPHSSVAYAASVLGENMLRGFSSESPDTTARGGKAPDQRGKLTLGIPFYGRHREDMRLEPETYAHLWVFIEQWARKLHPEWRVGGPELRALSEYGGYAFNGFDDVRRKMRLARDANISGIMIWELGQDVPAGSSPMSLMTAVQGQLAVWGQLPGRGAGPTDSGAPPGQGQAAPPGEGEGDL